MAASRPAVPARQAEAPKSHLGDAAEDHSDIGLRGSAADILKGSGHREEGRREPAGGMTGGTGGARRHGAPVTCRAVCRTAVWGEVPAQGARGGGAGVARACPATASSLRIGCLDICRNS
eukprot:gene10504-biopygen6203